MNTDSSRLQVIRSSITWKNALKVFEVCVLFFCLLKMCLNLIYETEAMYQTFIDRFLYCAVFYLLVTVLILIRTKIWHWTRIVYLVAFCAAMFTYFKINVYESELYMDFLMKWHAWGMFGLLILEVILGKKLLGWKERNKPVSIMFLASVLFILFVSPYKESGVILLMPFVGLYVTKIDVRAWNKLTMILSVAIPISGIKVMLGSLKEVPYTGARYFGTFKELSMIGTFFASGALCTIFWIFLKDKGRWKRIPLLCISAILFAVLYFFVSMTGGRIASLSLIGTLMITFIFWPINHKKSEILKRLIIIGVAGIICLFAGITLIVGLHNLDMIKLQDTLKIDQTIVTTNYEKQDKSGKLQNLEVIEGHEIPNNVILYNKILYWYKKANSIYDTDMTTFPKGSFIGMIDEFSSLRLGIWRDYLKETNLIGHKGLYLEWYHPHSQYFAILFAYGILGAMLVFAWMGYCTVTLFKKAISNDKIYLFSFIWSAITLLMMLTESTMWTNMSVVIMLLVQYPIFANMKKDVECGKERDNKSNV